MSASAKAEKTEHESEANHTVLSTDFILPTVTEIKTELEDVPSISIIPVSWDCLLKKPDLEEPCIVTPKNDIKMENGDDLHFNGFHWSDTTAGHLQDVAVKQQVTEERKFGDASCELLNLPRVTKIKVEPTFENVPSVTKLPSSWDCCDDSDLSIGVVQKHKGEMLEREDLSREKIVLNISSDIRRSSRLADKVVNIASKTGPFTQPSSFLDHNFDTSESVHDSDSSYVAENNSDAESETSDVETEKTATIVKEASPQSSKTLKMGMGVSKYLKVMKYYILNALYLYLYHCTVTKIMESLTFDGLYSKHFTNDHFKFELTKIPRSLSHCV